MSDPATPPGSALAALLFDFDGTIAETEGLHHRAFNLAFADYGLDIVWSDALYRDLLQVAGGKERLAFYLKRDLPEREAEIAPRIAEIHATKTRHFQDLARSGGLTPRPGIARLMAEAEARGVPIGIVTTTSRNGLVTQMDALFGPNALDRFATVITGEMAKAKKPDPDAYNAALAALDLPATRCVAIEDSTIGVAAARAAGLTVVATPSSYTSGNDLSAADLVVPDLGEPRTTISPDAVIDIDSLEKLVLREANRSLQHPAT